MSEFVIVIEADNKRAAAAYQKGLEDLERIWPQIMAYAEAVDSQTMASYERKLEEYKLEVEEGRKRLERYEEELRAWENGGVFRGARPIYPGIGIYDHPRKPWRLKKDLYESIRADLQHMANVAGAAIGPFRMTEHQVKMMVAWEDGSKIDKIKAGIANPSAAS